MTKGLTRACTGAARDTERTLRIRSPPRPVMPVVRHRDLEMFKQIKLVWRSTMKKGELNMSSLRTISQILNRHRNRMVSVSILATFLVLPAIGLNTKKVSANFLQQGPMTSSFNQREGTLQIFRHGQLVVVYQRDTMLGVRSIGNAITELYAPGHPQDNLVADSSPIVPPQLLIKVGEGDCQNNLSSRNCDYFAHHNPQVTIIQDSGSAVILSVTAQASQHDDKGTPRNFFSVSTITVPYHPEHTVIEYNAHTTLTSPTDVDFSLRPLPFYELVREPYHKVSYLNQDCRIATDDVPTSGPPFSVYVNTQVCKISPWAALYDNEKGNLGIILKSLKWSSGEPRLLSFTETQNHPLRPNLYFQSTDAPRLYQEGVWDSQVVFIAYTNASDYLPVHLFRECFLDSPPDSSATFKVKAKPRNSQNDVLNATSIEVQEGDTLCFTAMKMWDVGQGSISPDGNPGTCDCPVRDASGNAMVGALIGRIGTDGTPFIIGSTNAVKATRSGTLYLGSNDNLGPCTGQRGSCYDDNSGKVKVSIHIRRSPVVFAEPLISIDSPESESVGLTVAFRWHLRNAKAGEVYRYKVRLDKGSDACDSGIEEEFDADTKTCLRVNLPSNRYSNSSVDFAIQATDSQGHVFCTRGRRFLVDSQLPAAPECDGVGNTAKRDEADQHARRASK